MHRLPTVREQRFQRRQSTGGEAETVEDEAAPPMQEVVEEQDDADNEEHVNVPLVKGTGGMVYTHVPWLLPRLGCQNHPKRTAQSIREQAAARSQHHAADHSCLSASRCQPNAS